MLGNVVWSGTNSGIKLTYLSTQRKNDSLTWNCVTTTIQNPMSSQKLGICLDPKAGCPSEPYYIFALLGIGNKSINALFIK